MPRLRWNGSAHGQQSSRQQQQEREQRKQAHEREQLIVCQWLIQTTDFLDDNRNDAGNATSSSDDASWNDWAKEIASQECGTLAHVIGAEVGTLMDKQQEWVRQQIAISVAQSVKLQLTEHLAALDQRLAKLEQRSLSDDLKAEFAHLRADIRRELDPDNDYVMPMLALKGDKRHAA